MHLECAVGYLEERIPVMTSNSAARNKYEVRGCGGAGGAGCDGASRLLN